MPIHTKRVDLSTLPLHLSVVVEERLTGELSQALMRASYGLSPGLILTPDRSSNLFPASAEAGTGVGVMLLSSNRWPGRVSGFPKRMESAVSKRHKAVDKSHGDHKSAGGWQP